MVYKNALELLSWLYRSDICLYLRVSPPTLSAWPQSCSMLAKCETRCWWFASSHKHRWTGRGCGSRDAQSLRSGRSLECSYPWRAGGGLQQLAYAPATLAYLSISLSWPYCAAEPHLPIAPSSGSSWMSLPRFHAAKGNQCRISDPNHCRRAYHGCLNRFYWGPLGPLKHFLPWMCC